MDSAWIGLSGGVAEARILHDQCSVAVFLWTDWVRRQAACPGVKTSLPLGRSHPLTEGRWMEQRGFLLSILKCWPTSGDQWENAARRHTRGQGRRKSQWDQDSSRSLKAVTVSRARGRVTGKGGKTLLLGLKSHLPPPGVRRAGLPQHLKVGGFWWHCKFKEPTVPHTLPRASC